MGDTDPEEDRDEESQSNRLRSLGLFSVIVVELLGCTGAGIGIGYYAWSKWGAPWWVILLSSMLGLVAAFYQVYQISKKMDRG